MPEGSEHAAILIAISFQALNRVFDENPDMLLSDCTVLILFAGFYVEATLNHIFESIGKDIKAFPLSEEKTHGKSQPGMQDKLMWFYNEFIEDIKANNWREIREMKINEKLTITFPGFSELHAFRNDLSHGKVNETAKSFPTAKRLRQQAKDLVDQLYTITEKKGYNVSRLITYQDAIATLTNFRPDVTSISSS